MRTWFTVVAVLAMALALGSVGCSDLTNAGEIRIAKEPPKPPAPPVAPAAGQPAAAAAVRPARPAQPAGTG